MTTLLIVYLVIIAFMVLIGPELIAWNVYGRLLKDEEMEEYLKKYLPTATLNPFSPKQDLFADMPKYIAKINSGYLSKWHIHDYGRIPKKSKWSKAIDARHKELLKEVPVYVKPTLSEL